MVPSIEGEFARKRRMMSHAWPIVLRGGMLSTARLPAALRADDRLAPRAALRAPFLHVVLLGANVALLGEGASTRGRSPLQLPCSSRPRWAAACRGRPLLVARYYVLTTASVAGGLWDHLRHGTPAGWAPPEGTR